MHRIIKQLTLLQAQLDDTADQLVDAIKADLEAKIPYTVIVDWDFRSYYYILVLDVANADRAVVEAFFEAYQLDGVELMPRIMSPDNTNKYYRKYRK